MTTAPTHTPSHWPDDGRIRLMRRSPRCTVLGPGRRAVLWVQGCSFRCPGCVVPESLPFAGGAAHTVEELADWLAALPDLDGVTFSGGEPFDQAGPLAALIRLARRERDLSFLSYTGYTLEQLARRASDPQRDLLRLLDVVIDGPFIASRQTDLRWRGSDNQRVVLLTPRHRDVAASLNDRGRWLEIEVEPDGLAWMGIPPPGFRHAFESAVARAFDLAEPPVGANAEKGSRP